MLRSNPGTFASSRSGNGSNFVALARPLDFVTSNTIAATSTSGFTVDWGDGNPVAYGAGTLIEAVAVASGNIIVNGADVTQIRFKTDTYTAINISRSNTLTKMYQLCDGLTQLTSFAANDTSNVTDFSFAWRACSSLTSFPLIDTSSALTLASAWSDCIGLTSFPAIDTSAATSLSAAWWNCSFTSFPSIDTSSVTNLNKTWAGCSNLTSLPYIDTSSAEFTRELFLDCTSLVCLSAINTTLIPGASSAYDMFTNTPSLVAPTASEQTDITTFPPGLNYINPGACP